MDSLRIELLHPKASQLLDDLEDLKLIAIKREKKIDFSKFLKRLRTKSKGKISDDIISKEVESVRVKRYASKKGKNNR
jgi:hypothetical protein